MVVIGILIIIIILTIEINLCILVQNVLSSNHDYGGPIFAFFHTTLELNYTLTHGVRKIINYYIIKYDIGNIIDTVYSVGNTYVLSTNLS